MKASELIAALQAAVAEHGDLDIVGDFSGCYASHVRVGTEFTWDPRIDKSCLAIEIT